MGPRRFDSTSRRRAWLARIEHYTPDGALGRWLLGAPVGTVGIWLLAIVLFEIPRWGFTLGALVWVPVLLGAAIPALAFSVLMLWPIYLSLIGNIDSAESYSVSGNARSAGGTDATVPTDGATENGRAASDTTASGDTSPSTATAGSTDDRIEALKRQYAAGELDGEVRTPARGAPRR